MYHIRINTPPWGPTHTFQNFDAGLRNEGSTEIPLPFESFEYEADGLHFTRSSQRRFHRLLESTLTTLPRPLLILTDSTVDFHNWEEGDEWSGWATSDLQSRLGEGVIIDAVCGSGFVAGALDNDHFRARLSYHLRDGFRGTVLFMGGWNDLNISSTCASIRGCASLWNRYN